MDGLLRVIQASRQCHALGACERRTLDVGQHVRYGERHVTTDIDVWILGGHRLFCGDATSAEDVARALNGVTPALMVSDPPYGVAYDPSWRARPGVNLNPGKVDNDDQADGSTAWALFPGDGAYVWHAGKFAATVQASLEQCDFEVRSQII